MWRRCPPSAVLQEKRKIGSLYFSRMHWIASYSIRIRLWSIFLKFRRLRVLRGSKFVEQPMERLNGDLYGLRRPTGHGESASQLQIIKLKSLHLPLLSNTMTQIVDNLIKWLNLVEHTLLKPADRTQLDEWLSAAEDLTEGLDLEEPAADLLVQQILDGYEETLKAAYASVATPTIPKEKLLALCATEQIEQRTPAWYKQMGTVLSASELGSLFASPKSRATLILSKVNPSPRPPQPLAVLSASMSAFDWGIRFEPVVKQIYNHKYRTTIQELGRLVSTTDRRCSASPDGLILEDPASIRTGRLLEIKCPVTRQPDGKVPKDYYTQMQMQLFVTDLEACDFVEAVFHSPYSSPLKKDGPGLYYGEIALIHTLNELGLEENGRYEYGPVFEEPSTETWMPPLKSNEIITERIPWKLLEWHEQVVIRSPTWWPKTEPFVNAFWLDVERARVDPSFLAEHLKKKVVEEDTCLIRLPL